jgi:UMF1 family MFS transporter
MTTAHVEPDASATSLTQNIRHIPKRAVVSWVLYDLANTIFSMGVVSAYFSTWVRDQVGPLRADSVYGVITAISMGLIFFASPVLGAMTDRASRRMPFLVVSTLICVFFTTLLARGGFYFTAICFVIANVAYQAGLQFYDAMLPEVSHEGNRGKISGIGVGVGYLGSYIAIGLGMDAVFGSDDKPFLFTMIAFFFLLFALPCFLFVKERGNPHPREVFSLRMLRESTSETVRTIRSGREYPGLVRFLVGRIFYTDPINTVIAIMMLYTINVAEHTGLTHDQGEETGKLIMMTAITFAVVGGFVWGWLVDRFGPKRTLNYVLYLWTGVFLLAAAVGIFGLPLTTLYVVACAAGVGLCVIRAADRHYMLRLTQP